MEKVNVLNISIHSVTLNELLSTLHKGVLITPNVDHLVNLQKDKEFYEIYQNAEWIICDSKILNAGLLFLGNGVKTVIPGSSFFPAYYNYHKNNPNIKIFLLGAADGVAEDAKNRINEKIGRDIIADVYSPPFDFEKNEQECINIVNIINKSKANILVVGLGAPKQEKWIFKYKEKLPNIELFMALGATIDFEAGRIKRAPKFMQKIGMEWLFRLLMEPRRLWKRYMLNDLSFFKYIFLQKFGKYKDPFSK